MAENFQSLEKSGMTGMTGMVEKPVSVEKPGDNRIIVLFGKKRQGKTCFIKHKLEMEKPSRLLIYTDIRNDYYAHAKHTIPTFNLFQLATIKGYWNQPFSVRLKFSNLEYHNFAASVLQHVKHYLLILDELDVYCTAKYMPSYLKELVIGSGNNSIDIIGAAKRPRMTPHLLTSQADEFYIFHTRDTSDIDFINDWVGEEPPEPYYSLKRGEYFHYDGSEWSKHRLSMPWFQRLEAKEVAKSQSIEKPTEVLA